MKALVCILILVIVSACSTIQKDSLQNSQLYSLRKPNLQSLEFKTGLDIEGANGFGLSANMKLGGRDSMAINIGGPFGMQIAKVFSNLNGFKAHNIIENKIYIGKPNPEALAEQTGIYLDFEAMTSLFRCEVPGNLESYADGGKTKIETDKLFKKKNPNGTLEYVLIDLNTGTMKQYQQIDNAGETIMNVYFDNYNKVEEFALASRITVKIPKMNQQLSFEIEEIKVNKLNNERFDFAIPKSAEVIEIN